MTYRTIGEMATVDLKTKPTQVVVEISELVNEYLDLYDWRILTWDKKAVLDGQSQSLQDVEIEAHQYNDRLQRMYPNGYYFTFKKKNEC